MQFIPDLYSDSSDCVIIHNSQAAPVGFVLTTQYLSKLFEAGASKKYPALANPTLMELRLVSVNYGSIFASKKIIMNRIISKQDVQNLYKNTPKTHNYQKICLQKLGYQFC